MAVLPLWSILDYRRIGRKRYERYVTALKFIEKEFEDRCSELGGRVNKDVTGTAFYCVLDDYKGSRMVYRLVVMTDPRRGGFIEKESVEISGPDVLLPDDVDFETADNMVEGATGGVCSLIKGDEELEETSWLYCEAEVAPKLLRGSRVAEVRSAVEKVKDAYDRAVTVLGLVGAELVHD